MALFSQDFGIDLGTYYTMIAEEGVLLDRAPTVAAIAIDEQKIVEFGQAAKDMYGRVPDSLEIAHPLQHGVIADFEVTMKLLERMIKKVTGPVRLFHPRIMVGRIRKRTGTQFRSGAGSGCPGGIPDPTTPCCSHWHRSADQYPYRKDDPEYGRRRYPGCGIGNVWHRLGWNPTEGWCGF